MVATELNNKVNYQAAIGFERIDLSADGDEDGVCKLNPPDGTVGAILQFISSSGADGLPLNKPIARIAEYYTTDSFGTGVNGKSFYAFDYMYYNIHGVKNLIQARIKKATGLDSEDNVYVQVQYHK